MTKILITGGAGFIGRHLTQHLQRAGYWVRWLDNFDPQIHGDQAVETLDYYKAPDDLIVGDVRRRDDWLLGLEGVDAVVHLAAQTGTAQSMYQVARYTDVNIGGTALMWDVLVNERMLRVRQVVLASSRAIYGEGAYECSRACGVVVPQPRTREMLQCGVWEPCCPNCGAQITPIATPETAVPVPASTYACTKLAQEQMSITMGRALGIHTTALRLQNVYGPGQSLRNPYTGVISILSNQMRQNLPVSIYEDGQESRDFVFVGDVAQAFGRVLELPGLSAVLNVGSGRSTSVNELTSMLKSMWNVASPIRVTGEYRLGDIRHSWADLRRLKETFPDWQATNLETGLSKFVEWAQTQPIYHDLASTAAGELSRRNLR